MSVKKYLVVLILILIVGCDAYPGYPLHTGEKLSTLPLWWKGSANPKIIIGGDCHIDSINGKSGEPPEGTMINVENDNEKNTLTLKVIGWGGISVTKGLVAKKIAIGLNPLFISNHRLYAPTVKVDRPDVAKFFQNSASISTGFSSTMDLSDVSSGEYMLEVIMYDGENLLKCESSAHIFIGK